MYKSSIILMSVSILPEPAQLQAEVSPRTKFCLDLLRSMNKWKVVKEKNLTMERNILDHPENVKNFLNEIESKWDLLCNNCCFNDAFVKELEKGNKFAGSYPTILN